MAKRHTDAIAIQLGACNPSGIAHAIVEACAEIRAEAGHTGTDQITSDPAVRLMVHQLAFICRVPRLEASVSEFATALRDCEAAT